MSWPTKKLGEVSKVITGNTPSTHISEYYGGDVLWAGPSDLNGVQYIQQTKKTLSTKGLREGHARLVPKGAVLMSCIGYIGKISIAAQDLTTNQQINSFVPNKELINSEYLYYALIYYKSKFIVKTSQTTLPIINKSRCEQVEIPLPSLEIQKKLVKKIEELFTKIDQALSRCELATQGANSFIAATIHEALKKKPNWLEKKFGDIVEVDTTRNTKLNLPYVGMEDVSANGTAEFYGSLKPQVVKSTTFHFDNNHVLYGKLRPYLNKILIPQFEGHCSTEFLPLKPDEKFLIREWLALWLRSQEAVDRIMKTTTGARMPRADMKRVRDFIIPLPSIAEQKKIVTQLDAMTQKVREMQALQTETATNLAALKQSILHKAFRGELL